MPDPVFPRIAIIGAGLIGSSIARAAREYGAAGEIVLFDANPGVQARAAEIGLGEIAPTLEAAVAGADCVILCVPVGALGSAAAGAVPAMKDGAILTDVGSVKSEAARVFQAAADGRIHMIPGHPIAGTEQSGPDAGFPTLFQGAWHILTPVTTGAPGEDEALAELTAFWKALGAKVESMDAARHDRVLAITSHLPHLIAFNIVATAFD
ncbi:MAG: prephenate dehydrogenase/arogenate dehydrogenase family protein, partial [Hyphomonas sp.]|nr:prephenate dehydrogenase/arogenate dehydrogenase family protein [Hyphomonas sp.]